MQTLALVLATALILPAPPAAAGQDAPNQPAARAGDLIQRVRSLVQQAQAALAASRMDEARTLAHEALDALAQEPAATPDADAADARWKLALVAARAADFQAASEAFRSVLEYRQRTLPPDHADILKARGNLAAMRLQLGDAAAARAQLEAVLAAQLRTLPEDDPGLQRTRGNLAIALGSLGDTLGARRLEEQVLAVFERKLAPDDEDLQNARRNLSESRRATGDLEGALRLQEQVLAVRERKLPPQSVSLAEARLSLAATLVELRRLDEARELNERALAVLAASLPESDARVESARLGLADILLARREFAAARPILEQLLQARERRGSEDPHSVEDIRYELAACHSGLGDLDGARSLYEEVLAVWERTLPAADLHLARARGNLGQVLRGLGDPAGALRLFEQIEATLERELRADHPDLQLVQHALATARLDAGDAFGARELCERVLSVWEGILPCDDPSVLTARETLALALVELHRPELARAIEEDVLALRSASLAPDHADLIKTRHHLAWVLALQDDRAALGPLLAEWAGSLRRWLLDLPPLSARERAEAARSSRDQLALLLSLGEGQPALAEELFDLTETLRALATSGPQTPDAAAGDPALEQSRARARLAHERLGELVSGLPAARGSAPATPQRVAAAARERDDADRELRAALAQKGALPVAAGKRAAVAALRDGEAAVAYWRFAHTSFDPARQRAVSERDEILASVLQRDGRLARVDLGPAAAIEAAVRAWRDALGEPLAGDRGTGVALPGGKGLARASEEQAGRALRRLILDPVLARCGEARALRVCLDDVLWLVPLDALPLDEGDARVGDRLACLVQTSLTALPARAQVPSNELGFLGLGGIDYDAREDDLPAGQPTGTTLRLAPLPATEAEVRSIGSLFRAVFGAEGRILAGRRATKSALRAEAGRARWLHVATHGWFAPDALRAITDAADRDRPWWRSSLDQDVAGFAPMTLCGLACAGANLGPDPSGHTSGILTAEELAGLDLAGCELAVLSACETNAGLRRAGQGVASLQAALHSAGARSSLASLWSVPDQAASDLMLEFYRRIWVEKRPKSRALWEAKQQLRGKRNAQGQPLYSLRDWACWVLAGDPD